EGNYLPVFCIFPIGKGSLVLYGLGEDLFWQEDLDALFSYLKKDYDPLFQKIDYNIEFFKLILSNHPDSEHLKTIFISSLVRNKPISHILSIKDEEFQHEILKLLDFESFENFFQNLNGQKLEKAYLELKDILKNHKINNVLERLDLFFIKKISEKRISYKHLIDIFERNLLPPEAANLVVFFADPTSPQDFRNFRESIKKLIKWNKKIRLFEESDLKNLLWEKLQEEDEKIKRWEAKQRERKLKEDEERRRKEKERELRLRKIEEEILKRKKLEAIKKLEEEKKKASIEESKKKLREERKRKYSEEHQKRIEMERLREKKLKEGRMQRLKRRKERERRLRLQSLKRRKELEEEVKRLKQEKLKAEEEAKKREEEYKKLQEEWKKRTKKYKEDQKSRHLDAKKELLEKKVARLKALEEIKPEVTIKDHISEPEIKIPQKSTPKITITEELSEFIDFILNPYNYFLELQEYNKILEKEDSQMENIEDLIFEFIEFVLNPIEYLETLRELEELDDIEEEI
ncbi:MAG: hypothetical protein ACTSR3_14665, partial [Candidatus Helarchaeota archaeon]